MIDFFSLGLIMIVIGVILLVAEISVPGFFLAVPGTVLVILGLVYMFMGDVGVYAAAIITLATAVLSTLGIMLFYRTLAKPSPPTTTTIDGLVGKKGVVIAKIEPNTLKGKVRIDNDIWSATADEEIDVGKKVVVVKGEGVHLVVKEVK
jgi:membrane protein implicated in regulation of membrane protease activity